MDPRLDRDIHRLSTDDLVLAYGVLQGLASQALRDLDRAMASEFLGRCKRIERELASRQLSLEDELANLRRSNAS